MSGGRGSRVRLTWRKVLTASRKQINAWVGLLVAWSKESRADRTLGQCEKRVEVDSHRVKIVHRY